jgi:DNA mismatch repair protein MutL
LQTLSESLENEGIIRLLPPEIANKIAAGEVVQRPASVIKELLDNAIDAGASRIAVHIRQAGRTLIQVDDNGCGMSISDIPNCFLRHATSKITSVDDLYAIRTLGFRGEAMASIASVAQITLKTKRIEDESGYLYELWGGEQKILEPVATPNGTSISVRNLFYNVPARRAFLKTDATEFRHCIIIFQQMAMTNPRIAFEMTADGESIYKLPEQSLSERIIDIFGKAYQASLIPIDETAGFVRIRGYLSDPKLTKRNRGEQFLFVNGRPVMHRHLTHVVLEQYKNWISDNEYPFFAVFYEVDPSNVDVNVHPSKMEIQFEDERTISMLTRSVVRKALNERYSVPEIPVGNEDNLGYPDVFRPRNYDDFRGSEGGDTVRKFPSRINFEAEQRPTPATYRSLTDQLYGQHSGTSSSHNPEEINAYQRQIRDISRPERERSVGFWQLHNTYIITQTLTGMCLVDQHAAHKRIIYERVLQAAESGIPATQQLLFPQTLQLSASDYAELKNILDDLLRMGFDISALSGFTAVINGVPADINPGDELRLIESILHQYQNTPAGMELEPRQKIALALASRTAITRGKKMGQAEMETLIDQLFSCNQPYFDPSGKPTIIYLPLEEIRSRFKSG